MITIAKDIDVVIVDFGKREKEEEDRREQKEQWMRRQMG